ncbi:hypothetical protein N0V84_009729 [Fusarium piperis]|uniref:Uncharacterized protein n=1 Tax=Fusarium piperis TaxID=1435070 RepID=A0A9W8W5S5_9HYPO|nr:hypothetical protein N0V84_009729 [Fusarium piperis]
MKKADLKPIYTAGARLVEQCWEIVKQKPYTYQPDQVVEAFASTILCRYKAKDGRYEGAHSVIEQFAGFCMRANVNFYKDLQSNGGLWTLDTTLTAGETFGKTFKWYATNRRFFNKQANGLWGLGLAAMQLGDVYRDNW